MTESESTVKRSRRNAVRLDIEVPIELHGCRAVLALTILALEHLRTMRLEVHTRCSRVSRVCGSGRCTRVTWIRAVRRWKQDTKVMGALCDATVG